jgi:2-C-methyl-D-erythritol 4-phosphate cytidylyltransferase / 2-C-methyl-D-erythritol 2,4-cyclodiphosphate synthase
MEKVVALIVAAGKGVRAGGAIPKQYAPLGGIPVIARAIDAFAGMPVHVVIGEGQDALLADSIGERRLASVTIGGAERQDSVKAGLAAIGGLAEHVLIHDAARPLLPRAVIDRLIGALEHAPGAVPVLTVPDSVARADGDLGDPVDRSALVRVQTPQAFRIDAIMTSHGRWTGGAATDDAQVARVAGFRVATVEGDPMLDKITTAGDFTRAEAMLARGRTSRTAMGFDVHRLEAGQDLWLCGVKIAHDKGLSGHSDADVALHALTDAVLGTIGAGDIGAHFPPSDPQWRGASSDRFLAHARDLVAAAGGRIEHVDVTIICEAPKIGPHRDAMRASIARLLQLGEGAVSVKATTTEGLGLTGRGEGIAAQAVATVSMETGR